MGDCSSRRSEVRKARITFDKSDNPLWVVEKASLWSLIKVAACLEFYVLFPWIWFLLFRLVIWLNSTWSLQCARRRSSSSWIKASVIFSYFPRFGCKWPIRRCRWLVWLKLVSIKGKWVEKACRRFDSRPDARNGKEVRCYIARASYCVSDPKSQAISSLLKIFSSAASRLTHNTRETPTRSPNPS